MKKRRNRLFGILLAVTLLAGVVGHPAAAQEMMQGQSKEQGAANTLPLAENGVTVSTSAEFMTALAQKKSPITVNCQITIGDQETADKRLKPVYIPAGTLIQGAEGGTLTCRSPIQLEGDVTFKDIELNFTSTDSMSNIPHREIFLAGHRLTLDHVSTWLKGGGGTSGDLLGSEDELLPTVYGGGFTGSQVGTDASLTVRNSNDKTMFAAIYMGHDVQSDNKVPYTGTAQVHLDARAVVRGRVDVSQNSQAQITISGGENDSAKASNFYGNANTSLTVSGCLVPGARVQKIGQLVLQDGACLKAISSELHNVTLQNGACLDLNEAEQQQVRITGEFRGVENSATKRGILVVNQQKTLRIEGRVSGTTQFQTYDRLFPGRLLTDYPYISAQPSLSSEGNFVLSPQSTAKGYQLHYADGAWSVSNSNQAEALEIGSIEIVSHPSWTVLNQIQAPSEETEETIPNESVYFEIAWKDQSGAKLSAQEVKENQLYYSDYFILIKSEYWESDDPEVLQKDDWGNFDVDFVTSEAHPDWYFLQAQEGAPLGDYTFLFCSDDYWDDLKTVQDVKALEGMIKAECKVSFLEKEPEPVPPEEGETPNPPDSGQNPPSQPDENEPVNPPDSGQNPPSQPDGTETPDWPDGAETPVVPNPDHTPNPPQTQPPSDPTEQPSAPSVKDPVSDDTSGKDEDQPDADDTSDKDEEQPDENDTSDKDEEQSDEDDTSDKDEEQSDESEQPSVHKHVYRTTVIKATLKKNGTLLKKCSCGEIQTKQAIYYPKNISLSANSMTYTGKARKPKVIVKDQRGKVISSKNYRVAYKNNTKAGRASATITFRGNYSGTITKYFEITPPPTSLTRWTPKTRGFSLKWKKQGAQVDGYEIQYSTSRKFARKASNIITVKGNRSVTKTVLRQKAGKRYYLRIRTYKNVKVGGKTKRIYSEWSKVKSVTTRK